MSLLCDFCNRVNIGSRNKSKHVTVRTARIVLYSLQTIYKLGYLNGFQFVSFKHTKVFLKFINSKSALRFMSVVFRKASSSSLGLKKKELLHNIFANNVHRSGFLLMSISYKKKPVMTDIECLMLGFGGVAILNVS